MEDKHWSTVDKSVPITAYSPCIFILQQHIPHDYLFSFHTVRLVSIVSQSVSQPVSQSVSWLVSQLVGGILDIHRL